MFFLLLKAAELGCPADPHLLSYGNLPQCLPQQFGETLNSQFAIFKLAAGLLRDDAKDPVLPDAVGETALD